MPLPLISVLLLLWLGCSNAADTHQADAASALVLPTVSFDADRAFADIEKQCAFGPRYPGASGYAPCLTYMTESLRACTPHIVQQQFTAHNALLDQSVSLTNVLATFPGLRQDLSGAVLLCAHWDTRPFADNDPDPANHRKPVPGANDGASGVAVLLEVARQLHHEAPVRDVLIALWDGEDSGVHGQQSTWFSGARYWAQHPTRRDIRWGILLDMIGDRQQELPQEYISLQYAPSLVRRVWRRGAQLGFRAFQPSPRHAVEDDHLPLLEAGFQVIDIIDFDYPYWHTIEDTPDKCAPASLRSVGETVLSLVRDPNF